MWEATSPGYHKVIARAADTAAPGCAASFRDAFDTMQQLGATKKGRVELAVRMGLCKPEGALKTVWGAFKMAFWLYVDLLEARVQVGLKRSKKSCLIGVLLQKGIIRSSVNI